MSVNKMKVDWNACGRNVICSFLTFPIAIGSSAKAGLPEGFSADKQYGIGEQEQPDIDNTKGLPNIKSLVHY